MRSTALPLVVHYRGGVQDRKPMQRSKVTVLSRYFASNVVFWEFLILTRWAWGTGKQLQKFHVFTNRVMKWVVVLHPFYTELTWIVEEWSILLSFTNLWLTRGLWWFGRSVKVLRSCKQLLCLNWNKTLTTQFGNSFIYLTSLHSIWERSCWKTLVMVWHSSNNLTASWLPA